MPPRRRIHTLADGTEIESLSIAGRVEGAPTLVFLHEGLGCIDMWRDFPGRVAASLGWPALVYSRAGYGRSTPWTRPPGADFMHRAAREELPALLATLGIDAPVLVGHSDGGSIALIAAAGPVRARAVVAIAPHLFVEPVTVAAIGATRDGWHAQGLADRLARYHANARATFDGWTGVWLSPAFAEWDIGEHVAHVDCPILAIQGVDDQYGSLEQIHRIGRLARDTVLLEIPGSRHSPHLDAADTTLEAVSDFLRTHVVQRAGANR
jgi:pimeloyl-ACP methyl ester carboxylesterase